MISSPDCHDRKRSIGFSSAVRRMAGVVAGCLLFCGMVAELKAEPVYTKSRRFRIPFQVDVSELQRLGAKEVQLHVSQSSGTQWRLSETVAPDAGKFTFDAPADGPYWFSVKTLTVNGLDYPSGPLQAGLHVVVDSTPPQLNILLEETEPGRVRLIWQADDLNLDAASLRLEYQDAATPSWKEVGVRSDVRGQTTWLVEAAGMVQVRGTIADLAGNTATGTAEIRIAESSRELPPRPDFSRPVADGGSQAGGFAANTPMDVADTNASAPAVRASSQLTSASPQPTPVRMPVAEQQLSQDVQITPVTSTPQQRRTTHYVNSRVFRMGYAIEEIGPSGVGSVELYITEDNGKRWYHYGNDPDRVSPVEVTVPADGEYGFTFRVANGLGLVHSPPQPGELPEVTVTVDSVAPVARLAPVQSSQGMQHDQVMIQWDAHDLLLADRPIDLFYAIQPNGPWEAIQTGQANTGKYLWTVPSVLTQQFYVRMDVRDASGNVTRVETEKPYLIDRSQPRARVTEIESLRGHQR